MAKRVDVKKSASVPAGRPVGSPSGYQPWLALRDEVDRVFDRFFTNGWTGPFPAFRRLWEMMPLRGWDADLGELAVTPQSELSESDKEYELTIELPGLDEKDFEVTVSDRTLAIKGEKKTEKKTGEKDYYLSERSYGAFHRSFALPPGVDSGKVSATFSKGVLDIKLPKTAEAKAKPRKVSVKSA